MFIHYSRDISTRKSHGHSYHTQAICILEQTRQGISRRLHTVGKRSVSASVFGEMKHNAALPNPLPGLLSEMHLSVTKKQGAANQVRGKHTLSLQSTSLAPITYLW